MCVGCKGMAVEEEGCLELWTACCTDPVKLQPTPRVSDGVAVASVLWIPWRAARKSQSGSWALDQGLRPDQLVMQVGPALCSVFGAFISK